MPKYYEMPSETQMMIIVRKVERLIIDGASLSLARKKAIGVSAELNKALTQHPKYREISKYYLEKKRSERVIHK